MSLASPVSADPKGSRPRGSKVLLILGVVLLIGGFAAGRQGIHRVQRAADDISENADDIRNGILLEVPVPGDGEVDLERGRYDIYAVYDFDGRFPRRTTTTGPVATDGSGTIDPEIDDPRDDEPEVAVFDAAGRQVRTSSPGIESLFSGVSGDFYALRTFTVTEPGTYRVEAFATGTEADKIGVGPTVDNGNAGKLVGGGILGLVGFLIAGLGLVLALAGLIWFLVAGDGRPKPGAAGLYPPTGAPGAWPPPTAWNPPPPGPWVPPGPPAPGPWGQPAPGWAPPAPGGWAPPPVPPPLPPTGRPGPGTPPPPPPAAPWGAAPPSSPEPPAWSPRPDAGADDDPDAAR